jgi:hypothetical protein
MAAMTDVFENELLKLILQNENIADLGDATGVRGSSSAGSLYISLHTADPGEAGNQTTNEISYTSYARVAVARTTGAWTVSGNNGSNTAAVTFPTSTGGSATATHFGIGTASSGAGKLLLKGAISPSLPVTTGVTPEFEAGDLDINAN